MLNASPESKSSIVWREAINSAIAAGVKPENAADVADEVMLAYESRFSRIDPNKIGGTIRLDIALRYIERHALFGRSVVLLGAHVVPPMGTLKDIEEDGTPVVQWTSPADFVAVGLESSRYQLVRSEG